MDLINNLIDDIIIKFKIYILWFKLHRLYNNYKIIFDDSIYTKYYEIRRPDGDKISFEYEKEGVNFYFEINKIEMVLHDKVIKNLNYEDIIPIVNDIIIEVNNNIKNHIKGQKDYKLKEKEKIKKNMSKIFLKRGGLNGFTK